MATALYKPDRKHAGLWHCCKCNYSHCSERNPLMDGMRRCPCCDRQIKLIPWDDDAPLCGACVHRPDAGTNDDVRRDMRLCGLCENYCYYTPIHLV